PRSVSAASEQIIARRDTLLYENALPPKNGRTGHREIKKTKETKGVRGPGLVDSPKVRAERRSVARRKVSGDEPRKIQPERRNVTFFMQ
ncbi:unnamed protein product, partial [Amoebophrya sp. A25]